VLIAAITSCTNTSNPAVMIAAGLLAKKAVAKGLRVQPHIKTSLAPGSRVVTDYLERPACWRRSPNSASPSPAMAARPASATPATSIRRSTGDCRAPVDRRCGALGQPQLRGAHPSQPARQLPGFAAAGGRLCHRRPGQYRPRQRALGNGSDGQPVYLRDVWPTSEEINAVLPFALDPETFRRRYADVSADQDLWKAIPAPAGEVYDWPPSTYIARPPFFELPEQAAGNIRGARALLILGDSVTTDHISPAGSFGEPRRPAHWLTQQGVARADFNSYGARRGHHEVMMRGTFANVRIRNLMLPADAEGRQPQGGYTLLRWPADDGLCGGDAPSRAWHADDRSSPARNTAPARRATGRPRAPACSAYAR
jgi:aconitate hydratase